MRSENLLLGHGPGGIFTYGSDKCVLAVSAGYLAARLGVRAVSLCGPISAPFTHRGRCQSEEVYSIPLPTGAAPKRLSCVRGYR